MTVLVVGLSHRSAPVDVLERAAVGGRRRARSSSTSCCAASTSRRRCCCLDLQPRRGLRRRRRVPRRPRRRLRRAGAPRRHDAARAHRARLRALRGLGRRSTCSRWRPGSTRWSSARRRSSASSATPTPPPPRRGTVGRVLHELAQQALRVGKRVHAETGIDTRGRLRGLRGPRRRRRIALGGLAGRRAVLVGAGRDGRRWPPRTCAGPEVAEIVVLNRTLARARPGSPRSPPSTARPARAGALDALAAELAAPTCWWRAPGAVGTVRRADGRRPRWPPATAARSSSATSACRATSTPAVADAARRPLDRPGRAAARLARRRPRRRRRARAGAGGPRRRRPTSPRSAPPRSRPRSPPCAAAPPT